jgi:hypothetical protein
MAEVFNQVFKVAQRTKQSVQKNQRFAVTLFNKPEFVLLFYLVLHAFPRQLIFAKIIDLRET